MVDGTKPQVLKQNKFKFVVKMNGIKGFLKYKEPVSRLDQRFHPKQKERGRNRIKCSF
jgi:hypothetical protein